MRKEELIKKINEELEHIPRGPRGQNLFRARYNMIRRHDIGKDSTITPAISFKRALEQMKENNPSFIPTYDQAFFGI